MKPTKEPQPKYDFDKFMKTRLNPAKQYPLFRSDHKIYTMTITGNPSKENNGQKTVRKSWKSIKTDEINQGFLIKSEDMEYLSNSCCVSGGKEIKYKKWKLGSEHHVREQCQDLSMMSITVNAPNPVLRSTYSDNSTNTTNSHSQQYDTCPPANLQTASVTKESIGNKTQNNSLEVDGSIKIIQPKSSKFVSFFQNRKKKSVIPPNLQNNSQTLQNSTISCNSTNDTISKIHPSPRPNPNFNPHQLKPIKKYQLSLNHETKTRSTSIQAELQQKSRSKSEVCKSMEKQIQPTIDDFIVGACRGEGTFAKVYLAIHKKTGLICALKKVKKESVRFMLDQFIQEIKIQLFLNHAKLVKVYGYFSDAEYFYILIEYMEDGSLYSLMKKKKKIDEIEVAEKLNQICQGIKQMHDNNIVHRDLKPQNIVMSHGVCKICDFGWAAICEDRRQTSCGTLDYVCPQIIQGNSYDSGVDIWCIGVLAYELMCGKAPFYDISRKKTIQKIKNCKIESFPSHLSKKAIQFIQMILTKDPKNRIGIGQLLNSDFLANFKK